MTNNKNKIDNIFKTIFMIFSLIGILLLFIITFYIIKEGIQPFVPGNVEGNINFFDFITGLKWDPSKKEFGIGYMIIGTVYAMIISIVIAVPIGILTSIAIVYIMPKKASKLFTIVIELLASIPSVIYGIFGLGFIVPLIKIIPFNLQPQGNSLLAVSLVLMIMILPTIIAVTVSSLKSVPNHYREASLGLGATQIQTIFKVLIPSAKSGILAAVVLGVGRAIGETMAVILVAGNVSGGIPSGIFDAIRPLTANIAIDMSYASGLHRQVLFSTALVLFIFIFILNVIMQIIIKKGNK